ncbi:MAG: branched-chain amino acid transaminase [Nitrospinota bacterium]
MKSAPKSDFIWSDGRLVKWEDATVHLLTHTLHYGLGAFEGIRFYKTKDGSSAIFRLQDHTDRLLNSAKILGLTVPYDKDRINAAIIETVKANSVEEGYIRPLLYIGDESRGLNCSSGSIHLAIALWPWGRYLGAEALEDGINVKTSSFTRHHPNIFMTKAKVTGGYVNSILAKHEALQDGYDEALLLDPSGYVAEGSGENIFIVKNSILKTPPITSVLDGITRDTVITIAKDENLEVEVQFFSRDEIYVADEAFFVGTAAEVTPIKSLDNRMIGQIKEHPITAKIQKLYFEIIRGEVKKYDHWLEYIR